MSQITDRPLVCITCAFAAGIAAAACWPEIAPWTLAALAAVTLIAWIFRHSTLWAGLAFLALGVLAGAVFFQAKELPPRAHVNHLPPGGQTVVGTVASAPRYRNGLWSFVLQVETHETGRWSERVTGRLLVRLVSEARVRRGERWQLIGRLRPLQRARNPGGRSEEIRLSSLGVSGVFSVGTSELAEKLGEGNLGVISSHAFTAQQAALSALTRFVSGPYRELTAGLAASVIFGIHAAAPPDEISDYFRRAGTIHLLVVSGAMVSMVFGLVFLPGAFGASWRRFRTERQAAARFSRRGRIKRWPGKVAAVTALLVVTYYAVLTEGGQAVARAAIMGGFIGLALVLRRIPRVARGHGLNLDYYTLLAIAALVILIAEPRSLFQPGFQLSFAAVWAILFLTPKLQPLLGWMPRWLAFILAGTTAAQFATFPILAWHYGRAPLAGFVANLLAVPLASVVLIAGMLTCAFAVVLPWIAPVAGWVTGVSSRSLVQVSAVCANLPYAAPQVARPSLISVILWYGAMLALGWWLGRVVEASE